LNRSSTADASNSATTPYKKRSYAVLELNQSLLAHRKIVLATGVFDLLHLGHVRFLEESKRRGGPGARLVVVVASDRTVFRRKGRKPILPEHQRRELVASLRAVDRAILGHENLDMLGTIKEVKPDIICVGYDQQEIKKSAKSLLRREGLQIPIVQIPKFGPDGLNSSTKVKDKIAEQWSSAS
jgi:FAD synthetase